MFKLRQIVPQKTCLSCHGCCRFSQKESVWQPLFMFEEIEELVDKAIVPPGLFSHIGTTAGKAERIDLVPDGDLFLCPFFDKRLNACRIYLWRPFDCRLYPFLLIRKDNSAWLALDRKCPYSSGITGKKEGSAYVDYLVSSLGSEPFLSLAKKNPDIVQSYQEDAELLSLLPGLSAILYG